MLVGVSVYRIKLDKPAVAASDLFRLILGLVLPRSLHLRLLQAIQVARARGAAHTLIVHVPLQVQAYVAVVAAAVARNQTDK